MRPTLALATLTLGLACAGLGAPAATGGGSTASTAAGETVELETRTLTDPGMGGAPAMTVLVPLGWTLEGGLQRPAVQAYRNPVLIDVTIEAPDGRGVHIHPTASFEWRPTPQPVAPFSITPGGNFYMPVPRTIGTWLVEQARARPAEGVTDVALVHEEDVPAWTARLRELIAPMAAQIGRSNAMGAGLGVHQALDIHGTAVTLRYREDGAPREETALIAWQRAQVTTQGRVTSAYWGILGMVSLKGPPGSGYLDDPVLHAVLASARPVPAWQQRMDAYWQQIARTHHQGSMDRLQANAEAHQRRMRTLSEASELSMQGFRSNSAASDRGQAAAVDAIHERTPYATPSGGTVELPSYYEHVYTDGQGRYLLHNNALHDPNVDPALEEPRVT